ncbi:MAG: hypothetical protein F4Y95_06030 [Chloroflexi bacterium]|nr:hypothetical protein [Chloroflexota bacterium]MYD53667.1 hypothetical protein [Chloroflexota bacterium]
MPPRVRLSAEDAARLPALLDRVQALKSAFPEEADAITQVSWIRERYSHDSPLSLNLVTLLLFEHGVHRSVDQVSQDLAILPEETEITQHE